MRLGKTLLRLRNDQGLTQQEVGDRAGLATSYVSRIENGHVEPSLKTLSKIAKALGLPIASIFQVGARGGSSREHPCPVSSTGNCIGEQIRSSHGPLPLGKKLSYGKEELRLLRMTEYVATHGSKDVRRTLAVVLESLMGHSGKG